MPTQPPKNILIAPMDWGAGHTTRCIPLIEYILSIGHHPVFAGNEQQRRIVRDAFDTQLQLLPLDGYNITYSGWNRFLQAGLIGQLPAIAKVINREHEWLKEVVEQYALDGVISDNRYGLYHDRVPSVILTHQLRIKTGMGSAADSVMQRMHYRYLNKFARTWIVDEEASPGLAGSLSHPGRMPDRYDYIGLLSRMAGKPISNKVERTRAEGDAGNMAIMVLLSGPEPQRTMLSRILWRQALAYNGSVVFADGTDDAETPAEIPDNIKYHRRLGANEIVNMAGDVDMIICRSGYSTIMDLVAMGKRAILIPTPGQTEQMHLAAKLHKDGHFYSCLQSGFNLMEAVRSAAKLRTSKFQVGHSFRAFEPVMNEWIATL